MSHQLRWSVMWEDEAFKSISVVLEAIHCPAFFFSFLKLSCPVFLPDVCQEADGNNHCGKPKDAL